MLRFDLRTKIAATLCVLILLAMILIDFVFIVTLQKELTRTEIARAETTLARLAIRFSASDGFFTANDALERLRSASGAAGAAAASGVFMSDSEDAEGMASALVQMARQAARDRRGNIRLYGETWGVFWKRARFALVSGPFSQDELGGGVSLALSLEPIYSSLRHTQKVVFVYFLINGILLTLIGLFRISQVAVKPVFRLVKRADSYRDDEFVDFLFDQRGENEFNRLSRALNRMMQRISADREKLRATVRSLEKSNIDLKKAQSDVIQAEKLASVGRLSSGIAHEIGNPIGIVLGYLELLRQPDLSSEERSEYIRRSQNEINRINMILRQLLDFSRPSGEQARSISVHGVLTDITEVVKVQPLMAHVELVLRLDAARERVLADPDQLRQVFLNLIINAADAIGAPECKEKGRLTIESRNQGREEGEDPGSESVLALCFIDDGPGISERDIGNIFDPFFTTKAPGKGTGLGLSVCFMIIEKMGGRIFVKSREHEGTEVTLYLPLAPEDAP